MDPTGHTKGNNSSPGGVVREYKKIIQKEKNVPTLLFNQEGEQKQGSNLKAMW